MATTRDRRLDMLKGLLIAGVVVGHFLETSGGGVVSGGLYSGWYHEPQRSVLTFLYLFHMPLFIMLAGITASTRRLARRVTEMVVLYVIFQTVFVLLRGDVADLTLDRYLHPVYALWFLLAMGWWLLSMPLVKRLGATALPLAVVVSLLVVTLPLPDTDLAAWMRAACYWPFFVLGHLHGKRILQRTAVTSTPVMVSAAAVAAATTWLVVRGDLDPRWFRGADGAASMGVPGLEAVGLRALCLVLALVMGAAVLSMLPARMRRAEGLGRRSLAVYALHVPVVFWLQAQFQGAGIGELRASVMAVAASVVVVRVLAFPVFDDAVRRTASSVAGLVVPDREREKQAVSA